MSVWGNLAERYEGKENEKHRLLALDGGGIRGIKTLEILVKMEEMLAEARGEGSDFRLCHFFDYIGGTSTGAIIAAGLARGKPAKELLEFYENTGPAMFDKQFIVKRWHAKYKSEPLKEELQDFFGADTTLKPDDLQCLLLAVTRNRTTDSPWPISSNPEAKYNDTSRWRPLPPWPGCPMCPRCRVRLLAERTCSPAPILSMAGSCSGFPPKASRARRLCRSMICVGGASTSSP